jgi:uncharacterized SAM-binding protein YcdF (DUF218 family)
MIKKESILIIGSVDWITNWQTQHRLADNLSVHNKVLFIENTGVRNVRLNDIVRIKDRFDNWKKSSGGFAQINKNLVILSPIVFPFPHNYFFSKINAKILSVYLNNSSKILDFRPTILITFLPTKLSLEIKNLINCKINIYYCANEMKGIQNQNKLIDYSESEFFKNSDHVFVISKNLEMKAKKFSNNVSLVPTGVELNKFNYSKVKKKKIPYQYNKFIVGYVGSITEVFDIDLIDFLVKKNPQFNFVFVGRSYVNLSKLKKYKNIFFKKEVSHSEVPAYIKSFDIGIIPYKVNEFTNSVYSCKLNEYLSMGIPVVSTCTKEIILYNRKFGNVIGVAKNYHEFNSFLSEEMNKNNLKLTKKRISIAKKNSWESRYEFINNQISKIQINKFLDNQSLKQKINKYKNNNFFKKIDALIIVFFITILLIFSPISLILGDYLVVKDQIKTTNNISSIVVFSGNGESNYNNLSYQKRYLDILNILPTYGSKKFQIYLSGKKFIFNESKIIKSFLIENKKFDKSDIYIIDEEKTFFNTYNNIIHVGKILENKKISNIIFLTSPYHSLRSKLIWKKNFPKINVIIPMPNDYKKEKIYEWGINFSKKKIIIYELLAILYNKYLGWI